MADQNLKMHQALMVADSEVAEEEGGEEVEALVETGVVLVVEGEGVEDSELEGVGIEEEEVVNLLEVAGEIGAEVDLVEEEAEIVEVLLGVGEETGEVMVGVGVAVVVGQ